MKKILSLTLAVVMMTALLAGCNTSGNNSSSGDDSNGTQPTNSLEQIIANGKIVLGTSPDFAPYEFYDLTKTGQDSIVGADIELAKYIAEKLGVELEIQAMEFSAVTASVQQGTIDMGISGFAWREDRAESMDLSDPYNRGGYQGLMVLAAEADQYTKLEDFEGKRIAAQNGSLQHELISEHIPSAEVQLVAGISEGIMMLLNGRVDALGMSGASGDQYVKNYPELVMSEFHYDYQSVGTVICLKKNSPELLAAINEIIAEVNDSGIYENQWVPAMQELADSTISN